MREMLILFFVTELIVFLYLYNIQKKLTCPSSVFTIFYLLFIIISLLAGDSIYSGKKYGYDGYIWLELAIIFVNVGYAISSFYRPKRRGIKVKRVRMNRTNLKSGLVLVSVFLIAFALVNYISSGGFRNASQNAYDYYTGNEVQENLLLQLVNYVVSTISLIMAFLGGFYLMYEKKFIKKLPAFAPLLYQIINMLYSSQKLGIILSIMLMFIGYLVASLYYGKKIDLNFTWKIIKRYWLIIPLIFAIFVLAFMLRYGVFNTHYLNDSINKINVYAFGSPHAFNYWYINGIKSPLNFGINSFSGIPHSLGFYERDTGFYLEMVHTSFGDTNVFMGFRTLIDDFGTIGSLLFLMVFAFISNCSYSQFVKNKTYISEFILVMSYLYIIFSIFNSPFVYLNLSVFMIIYLLFKYLVDILMHKKSQDFKIRIKKEKISSIKEVQI